MLVAGLATKVAVLPTKVARPATFREPHENKCTFGDRFLPKKLHAAAGYA